MTAARVERPHAEAHSRRRSRGWKRAGLSLLIASAATIPVWASDVQLLGLTNVLAFAIALLGFNILAGYNGQLSLGHAAFYAIGAYTAAVLITHFAVPHSLTVPLAGVVCLGAGFLVGWPAVRLRGMYLALATFALGAVLPQVAKSRGIERWTGGSQGMALDEPHVPFGLPLSFNQWLYFLTLLVLVLSFAVAANLLRGRIGRALIAIRDHPIAAGAMGIDATRYKALAFGISAMYTGIAGALATLALQYVAPATFNVFLSFSIVIGSAVGGIASLAGAIYGAVFLQVILFFAGFAARSLDTAHVHAIYGLVLILFLYFLPSGIAGGVDRIAALLRRRPVSADPPGMRRPEAPRPRDARAG